MGLLKPLPALGKRREMDVDSPEKCHSPTRMEPSNGLMSLNDKAIRPVKMRRAATVSILPTPNLTTQAVDLDHKPMFESTLESKDMIRRITPETLVKILDGQIDEDVSFFLIDARYAYEYYGGHIRSGINIVDVEELEKKFFQKPPSNRVAIVFHCEYSIQRAPQMYST